VKQKRQIGILFVLVVIALVVWLWNFHSKPRKVDADTPIFKDDDHALSVDNPKIRMDEIARARKTEYKSSGRNPFSPIQTPPPGVPHVEQKREFPGPRLPPAPPPPPPLTLPSGVKFYGFGTVPNGTSRQAFFTDGQEVYLVAEGEVFLQRFRILRIGNASVEFQEISSGRTATAPLEEQAGGSP
jgi:hypothetical protein